MKAVMLSIQPKWCELIASGKKTIEVRKTRPSIETPFKCYIYCTKQRMTKVPCMYSYLHINEPIVRKKYKETVTTWGNIGDVIVNRGTAYQYVSYGMQGKVIGEFVCDRIEKIEPGFEYYSDGYDIDDDMLSETCLTREELMSYGKGKPLYGWHISDLKIYDKPKELGEFRKPCPFPAEDCTDCPYMDWDYDAESDEEDSFCKKRIARPFQSWGYCEELIE